MSLKIDRLQLEIIINNDQARKSLRALEDESRQLTNEMKKLDKSSKEYADGAARLKAIKQQMDGIYESIGITGLTMKELVTRQRELNAIMRNMDPRLPEYKKLQDQAKAVGDRIAELRGKAKDTGLSLGKVADGFNKYFGMATAGLASLTGVIFSLRKVVDTANQFEKRVDNLSALTGLMGRDLQWLSQQALDMSTSVVEGNIRITSSADEIVDAFTKVGSKRPELLKVKEDLHAVTQEAMILAAAADGELQPAVDALTMVLNQFDLPANESRRVINVLAAGSKEGAGEIDYLTAAFEKAGSVANMLDISVEELTGTIETLAPKMTEPEMAGRNLRNILIQLESQNNDNLKPSLVGIGKAFENLRDQQLNITQLTKLFGQENINAATILMNSSDEIIRYTNAVTGTNVALEQANTNTDNNASKLDQARNQVKKLSIEFGQRLAPAMTFSTNVFGAFMKVALGAPDFFKRYQIAIIALVGSLLAYNAALIKSTALKAIDFIWNRNLLAQYIRNTLALNAMVAAEKLKAIWTGNATVATKIATTAQYAWNAAMKANPIGLVITGITALIAAIKIYDQNSKETIRLETQKKNAIDDVKKANTVLGQSYDVLNEKMNSLNKLSAEQKRLLLEETAVKLKSAEADLVSAKAKQEVILKDNTRLNLWERTLSKLMSFQNPVAAASYSTAKAMKNGFDAADDMNDGINELADSIAKMKQTMGDLDQTINAESFADQITGKSVSQLEEKQRYLQTALKNFEKGSEDYIRIQKKLQQVNKLLDNSDSDPNQKQKTAYDKLRDSVSKLEEKLQNLVVTGSTIPKELVAELLNAQNALTVVNQDIENASKGYLTYEEGLNAEIAKQEIAIRSLQNEWLAVYDVEELEQVKNELKQIGDEIYNTVSSFTVEDSENFKKNFDAELQKELEWKDAKYQVTEQLSQSLTNIVNARMDAEHERKLSLLEKERDAELANKNLTEKQKEEINKKYDAKIKAEKKKEWRRQQIADASSTTIATILAVMKAGGPLTPTGAATALAGALGVIEILATPVPEFSRGKYNVIGQTTGNSYSADYSGPAQTGMYTKPSLIGLVGEKGPEIVIDNATTRNLQMNYPEVIRAINYARVPQYASGSYPSAPAGSTQTQTASPVFDPEMITAMNRFSDTMEKLQKDGVRGKWSLFDLEKIEADKAELQSQVDM